LVRHSFRVFFFQAEDGIRDRNVTGVQTCALPISGFLTHGAWAYDPRSETRPLVLLAEDADHAAAFRDHLVRVGIDAVAGYITTLDGLELVTPKVVSVEELPGLDYALLLDMRNKTEFADGHVPGATQLSAGRSLWHTNELPRDATIVTYCQSGRRSGVASAALRRAGFDI